MNFTWENPQTSSRPSYDETIETVTLPENVCESVASYQDRINHYLFEISCLTGFTEWMSKGTLPGQFIKFYEKAISLYDELVQYLVGHLRREGFPIQCSPGCIHCCCHMPTGITTPELIYLYYGMHQSGIFPRFFRRCLEAEEQWREILKSYTYIHLSESEQDNIREITLKRYHRLEHYCPFLQDNLCQVYPYRPLACRMHFSLSSPHWCRPSHFQNEHAVRFNLEPEERIFSALERLEDRLQLQLSDIMVCGLLELIVNVMKFEKISWIN